MAAKNDRIAYKDAATIGREAIRRALEAKVSKTALTVLFGCVSYTALYSRQEDRIAVNQLVDFTGLKRRSVTNGLVELRECAVISREGKGGRNGQGGIPGTVRLLSDEEARVQLCTTLKGADIDTIGCSHSAHRVQSYATHREGFREEDREESTKGSPGVESLLATPPGGTAQVENPRPTLVAIHAKCRCGQRFSGDSREIESQYAAHYASSTASCGGYGLLYERPDAA